MLVSRDSPDRAPTPWKTPGAGSGLPGGSRRGHGGTLMTGSGWRSGAGVEAVEVDQFDVGGGGGVRGEGGGKTGTGEQQELHVRG